MKSHWYSDCEYSQPALSEQLFVICALLLFMGAFLNLGTAVDLSEVDEGMLGMQILWAVVYVLTLFVFGKSSRDLLQKLTNERWLVLLVSAAVLSALWSDDPSLTLRHSFALVGTTLFGLYFADRYPLKQQLRFLTSSFLIAATASVVFEICGIGTPSVPGLPGWIGVFVHKNTLGQNMAIATAVFLVVRKSDTEYRTKASLGLCLSIPLLLMSKSTTAILMLLLGVIVIPFSRKIRESARTATLLAALAIPLCVWCCIWAYEHIEKVTAILGRDPTLTGRLQLWILCAVMALQKPWLGYGYSGFWRGWAGPSAAVWRVLGWDVPHSHNGLLEVWLGLGLLGVLLYVIGFVVYARRAIIFLRAVKSPEGYWPVLFLTLMFVSSVTEATILSRNSLLWILYVTVGISAGYVPRQATIDVRQTVSKENSPLLGDVRAKRDLSGA